MKKREMYIDVTKGILMILLILHHLPQATMALLDIHTSTLEALGSMTIIYSTFFMPLFFILTGYCSNFKKNFWDFILTNIRTLLIPAIAFTILCRLLYVVLDFTTTFTLGSLKWIFDFHILKYGTDFWFLDALFLAKIIYKIQCTLFDSRKLIFFSSICVLILGIELNSHGLLATNYWHVQHAMVLLIFICIGDMMKNKEIDNRQLLYYGCFYIIALSLILFESRELIPKVTRRIAIGNIANGPLYLFLSLTGSSLLIYLSRQIGRSQLLSYIGKGSLIVYVIHHPWLLFLQRLWTTSFYVPEGLADSLFFYVCIAIGTTIICCGFIYVFNTPFLKWIIGK